MLGRPKKDNEDYAEPFLIRVPVSMKKDIDDKANIKNIPRNQIVLAMLTSSDMERSISIIERMNEYQKQIKEAQGIIQDQKVTIEKMTEQLTAMNANFESMHKGTSKLFVEPDKITEVTEFMQTKMPEIRELWGRYKNKGEDIFQKVDDLTNGFMVDFIAELKEKGKQTTDGSEKIFKNAIKAEMIKILRG